MSLRVALPRRLKSSSSRSGAPTSNTLAGSPGSPTNKEAGAPRGASDLPEGDADRPARPTVYNSC
jgi:hypothetical protein